MLIKLLWRFGLNWASRVGVKAENDSLHCDPVPLLQVDIEQNHSSIFYRLPPKSIAVHVSLAPRDQVSNRIVNRSPCIDPLGRRRSPATDSFQVIGLGVYL
jgi:hypothetical protein